MHHFLIAEMDLFADYCALDVGRSLIVCANTAGKVTRFCPLLRTDCEVFLRAESIKTLPPFGLSVCCPLDVVKLAVNELDIIVFSLSKSL